MKSSHTKKSDEELYLELYGDKDSARKAFEEIYQRYSSKVYTFCSRVMGDTELADDIFQETFINFYESALVEREMKNVSAYIFKIARNLCINEKQKK
ncbi:MAG: hypothetical protein QG635_977, partial [Bacteroidota bacterium]|nr:hypothetical protein [Bacteroidota bacterium]